MFIFKMSPLIILPMVIVSYVYAKPKIYLIDTVDHTKSDTDIDVRNDTSDYGQDYDPENSHYKCVKQPRPAPPAQPAPQAQPTSTGACNGYQGTNDYGQDYDPEGNPIPQPQPTTPAQSAPPDQPASTCACSGNLEFGWAYPSKADKNNDLNWGATDKRNSPQECQIHCKNTPRCVGFTWVDGLNNCWIKHDMAAHFRDNRGPGFISGRKDTCIGPAPWPLVSCANKKICPAGPVAGPVAVPVARPQSQPNSQFVCTGGDICCSPTNQCPAGEGDCDNDNECQPGLRCGRDNCRNMQGYPTWSFCGWDKKDDCCEPSTDSNGVPLPPTLSPSGTPEAPGGCFPGTSMVMLDGGEKKSMEELRIGDTIMTVENGNLEPTSVLGFLDKKVNKTAYYINLILEDNRSIFISSRHVMFIKGDNSMIQNILAKDVSLGDMVIVEDGKKSGFIPIRDITVELKNGAYVPLTNAGTLLVDGVLVSSYTNTDHWLAHMALSPLRWWPTLLLDTELSQNQEGLRIFPRMMRNLGSILGLVTMADGKKETIENPVLGMSQLAMEKIDKTEI